MTLLRGVPGAGAAAGVAGGAGRLGAGRRGGSCWGLNRVPRWEAVQQEVADV